MGSNQNTGPHGTKDNPGAMSDAERIAELERQVKGMWSWINALNSLPSVRRAMGAAEPPARTAAPRRTAGHLRLAEPGERQPRQQRRPRPGR
jgi:hypothetical protein